MTTARKSGQVRAEYARRFRARAEPRWDIRSEPSPISPPDRAELAAAGWESMGPPVPGPDGPTENFRRPAGMTHEGSD